MSKPQVSVIVPCYKQAHFLPEALASVQAQTFQDWECIIVNDGSPDNTAEVAREWTRRDARFRYLEKPNGGLSSARNAGLAVACGEFLHFLDSDDCVGSEMYTQFLKVLGGQNTAVAGYSGYRHMDQSGVELDRLPVIAESADVFHDLLERNPWPCHALLVRKAAVDSAGPFDEALRSCEDWDLWLRVAFQGGRFVPIPGEFACYRQYASSMSRNHKGMWQAACTVIRRNAKRHKGCARCRISAARGLDQFWQYCWHTCLAPETNGYLLQGAFGLYLKRCVELALYDPRAAWVATKSLVHQKRRMLRYLLHLSERCLPNPGLTRTAPSSEFGSSQPNLGVPGPGASPVVTVEAPRSACRRHKDSSR